MFIKGQKTEGNIKIGKNKKVEKPSPNQGKPHGKGRHVKTLLVHMRCTEQGNRRGKPGAKNPTWERKLKELRTAQWHTGQRGWSGGQLIKIKSSPMAHGQRAERRTKGH